MSPADHARVMEILADAMELPTARRAAFPDSTCLGEPKLRRDVEELLDCAEPAARAFDAGSDQLARTDPEQIGAYTILEPIGKGGMAIVYRAQQAHPVRRTVALKLIKLGMDTRQFVARFKAEQQTLAMLDHPNVARVYDAGASEKGRPYFVMEYVPGAPILEYCDSQHFGIRQRLELFIDVCDAIEYAHRQGIIHRDLKDSNVLVSEVAGKSVPKVIDFGVAKAVSQRLTDRTLFTEQGQLIGTPEYMSPEQAERGMLDIDTRSDIYSLGVLLYELLAGVHPIPSGLLRGAGYGTSDDDSIIIDASTLFGVTTYYVTVNGETTTLGPTNPAGNSITVNAKEGNDSVSVLHEGFGDLLNVHGNAGDDHLVVGFGDLGPDIDGTVQLMENPGEGNDSVAINDASGSTDPHNTLHVTASSVYADETATFDATVGFGPAVEQVTLNCSPQADNVHVDAPVAGTQISLGAGANKLYYGGSSHGLFGTVYPMTITAGVNDDRVIFDDSGGGTTGRDYSITPTTVMNQTLSGFEHLELRTRAASAGAPNALSITGKPGGISTIEISGGWTSTSIGSSSAPLDLDSTTATIISSVLGQISVWDQDADGILHPFQLWAVGNPKEQQLIKGSFRLNLAGNASAGLFITGGSTNDVFNVAGVGSSTLQINGGDGNDALVPFNFAGFNNSSDLDAVFTRYIEFYGGAGIDSMELFDTADAVGDGDSAYLINDDFVGKGAALGNYGTSLVHYGDVEQINFAADGDDNSITFGAGPNVQLTIDGGAGNDFFTNLVFGSDALNRFGGPTTIFGNSGDDSLNVVDRVNQAVSEYDVDPLGLSFRLGGGSLTQAVAYDGSLESFTLDENDAGALSQIRGKLSALRLAVNGWAGNDSYVVGGGDFDGNGWVNGTHTLAGGTGNDSIEFDDHLDFSGTLTTT
jgi:serine/threonine protein kinase